MLIFPSRCPLLLHYILKERLFTLEYPLDIKLFTSNNIIEEMLDYARTKIYYDSQRHKDIAFQNIGKYIVTANPTKI
jgi:hypothetical protein